jgi:hypothetical protein
MSQPDELDLGLGATLHGESGPRPPIVRTAILSDEQPVPLYRYTLTRAWGPMAEPVVFVMLNPSTADAEVDDPTIRRCMGFARDWGYHVLTVVNLYAWRATKPSALWAARAEGHNIIGPLNDTVLDLALGTAALTVAAWGANAEPHRGYELATRAKRNGVPLFSLGTTASGAPRHPLYVRGDTQPERWPA